jgi:hypothetical protein
MLVEKGVLVCKQCALAVRENCKISYLFFRKNPEHNQRLIRHYFQVCCYWKVQYLAEIICYSCIFAPFRVVNNKSEFKITRLVLSWRLPRR